MRYIKDVRVSTPQGSADDKVDMNISIEEGKSGTFSAGVTYSQLQSLAFTGNVEEQNLFGDGYHTKVSADLGGASTNYSVSLIDPYFMDEDVSASLSLFDTQSDLQSFTSYKQASNGIGVGFGFALTEYMRYSINYKLSETTLTDVPATSSAALLSQEGTFTTGELTQSLSYDSRNRVMAASDGGLYSLSLGYAGLGGDYNFYELGLSSRTYLPINDTFTFSASLNAGTIRSFGGVDEPLYRRYSLGGVGSLRGYNNFGVSVRDPKTDEILGGQNKTTASLDILFPLPYMATAGFRGAFFIDAGTVWGSSGSVVETLSLSKLRGSYGFGIEWTSPIGPVTLTWATAVNTQASDQTNGFEFGIGRGF
ncbi:MAG: outer membrane protein assembly factor BamA, partial [Ghiorsea sp.]